MSLNLIGPWGRVATEAARHLRAMTKELNVDKNVQMEAYITFSGDYEEGLHPAGSLFFTTEARASKYERNLPRLAKRISRVEVRSGTVKRRKPAAKPEEQKVSKPKAKKAAKPRKR